MATHKITSEIEIKPGQWVCRLPFSMFSSHLCDRPQLVMGASGQRIYLAETSGANQGNYISRSTAAYLCDTEAEALAVYAVSESQARALQASRDAIKAEHEAKIAALIAGSAA
jgi:hypothetical protein